MSVIFSEKYYTYSNRESDEGRYDIMLLPKSADMPGIIIEVKAAAQASKEELKLLACKALQQIDARRYDTELVRHDVRQIYKYGIAFCGKSVEIASN